MKTGTVEVREYVLTLTRDELEVLMHCVGFVRGNVDLINKFNRLTGVNLSTLGDQMVDLLPGNAGSKFKWLHTTDDDIILNY